MNSRQKTKLGNEIKMDAVTLAALRINEEQIGISKRQESKEFVVPERFSIQLRYDEVKSFCNNTKQIGKRDQAEKSIAE